MFNRSTRRLALSALPVILAVTFLAPAGGIASAAGPDSSGQLTLHLAGGDQNVFNVASARVTGNQLVVTTSDSWASIDLANIGALGEPIASMVLNGQGCQQDFNDARVASITFSGGNTSTASVAMTVNAQAPVKCQNGGTTDAWSQVTNQTSLSTSSASQTTPATPTPTVGGQTNTANPPAQWDQVTNAVP